MTRILKVDVRVVHVRRPLAIGWQGWQSGGRVGRRWRRFPEERQRQEDEETTDDLQQPAVATAQQAVPENAIPRTTRKGGARRQSRTNANTGQFPFLFLFLSPHFLVFSSHPKISFNSSFSSTINPLSRKHQSVRRTVFSRAPRRRWDDERSTRHANQHEVSYERSVTLHAWNPLCFPALSPGN